LATGDKTRYFNYNTLRNEVYYSDNKFYDLQGTSYELNEQFYDFEMAYQDFSDNGKCKLSFKKPLATCFRAPKSRELNLLGSFKMSCGVLTRKEKNNFSVYIVAAVLIELNWF